MDPPVGKDPDEDENDGYVTAEEEGSSIMDTLSDLADGVDYEHNVGTYFNCLQLLVYQILFAHVLIKSLVLSTTLVKGLLYKVKRERDTYKRSNHALQQSLSEALALKTDLESEHRQALDVILCTANGEKRRLEEQLRQSQESKRKLKKLVSEMIEEKTVLEEQMKVKEERLKEVEEAVPSDAQGKLEEERARNFNALSDAITDLEAKFECDMKDVIREKDEEMERKEKEHKRAVAILKDAIEEMDAEMKKERRSHSMVVKALEDELKTANESLNKLMEEHAMSDDVHDMEIAELRKEFEGMKSRVQKQFKQKESQLQEELANHSAAIDELETKLQTESMQCQVLVSELATKKEELVSKDAEIITLEKKLSERNTTYTREYDRMKTHLTKMCNLVESSSADRDLAREETKKLKAEHEKQNKAHKAEIEKLRCKLEDSAREMAQLVSSGSGESQESEIPQAKKCDVSKERSDKVVLLNRLEIAMRERDELAVQVQKLTADASSKSSVVHSDSSSNEEESVTHLGDVEPQKSSYGNLKSHSNIIALDSLVSKVQELEAALRKKDEEVASLKEKLALAHQKLESTLEESCKEVIELNEKLELSQQELESTISQKNEEIAALTQELQLTLEESCKEVAALNEKLDLSHQELKSSEERLALADEEHGIVGTIEQDLCEYSMAKLDKKLNETEVIKQERDHLRAEVERLEALLGEQVQVVSVENDEKSPSGVNDKADASINEKIDELARLEALLAKQKEELSDYKIKVCMHERLEKEHNQLTAELAHARAALKERDQSDDVNPSSLNEDIVETCLSRYEKENESLRATLNEKTEQLARLEENLVKQEEEMAEYKSKASLFESMERERDNLKAELTTLKATVDCPDDASAAAKLGEDISNLKLEHSVEVKLLKKDHAITKTKVKLLKNELQKIGSEQREMINAYDAEREHSAELTSSLEEMVTLLENERVVHKDQVDALRTKLDGLKIKFNRLKKKRVPIDAAYKASRMLLDSYEASGSTPEKRVIIKSNDESSKSEIEEIKVALSEKEAEIKMLQEELQLAKSKSAELETLLGHQNDDSIKAALIEKQAEIEALRADLKSAKSLYDELSQTYSDDMKATREELTQEMSRLHQAHSDSMQAYLEAGSKYEADIAKVNAETANKVAEIASLTEQLAEAKAELEEVKSHVESHVKDEESISKLQHQIREEIQLKEASLERVHVLEDQLNTVNSHLIAKVEEVHCLTQQLDETKVGLDELESQLEIHVEQDGLTIQSLEQRVNDERQLREATVMKMNSMNAVIDELKSKLAASESSLKNMDAKYTGELKHSITTHDKMQEQLKASQSEVEELNVKLDYCEGKLASAQREQSQLVIEATERQEELKSARDEIDELNKTLAHYQEKLTQLQTECNQLKQSNDIATCSQREYQGEAEKYLEEIELLKKQMTAAEIKSKLILKEEVDRLKAEFNDVITAFEKELVDTCESNANEVNKLQQRLTESKETIALFEIQIAELKCQHKEINDQLDEKMAVEVDLATARKQLLEAESTQKALTKLQEQHDSLMESFDEIKQINIDLAKTLEETEASKHELKSKLHDTLLSVDSNLKAFNNLRVDHDFLQKECEVLRGDSSSLHALVSSLTREKEDLMNEIDKQAEQCRTISDIKSSLEQEVEKYKDRQSSLEQLLSNLRDELEDKKENIESLKSSNSSKQQQIVTLQEQSKTANGHLDEMVTYCDKLKSDFATTSASLRREIDEQAVSMKDVINALKNQLLASENEKEENRKMYESDIELQQSVSPIIITLPHFRTCSKT
jgi:chromosome segregation ATPase